jgi:hypothetical protein
MKYSTKTGVMASLAAAIFMGGVALAPVSANAQSLHDQIRHRQKTKNNWRNAAIGAGALGVLGFATHNNALGVAGAAGAVYSASRYDHDRRSQTGMKNTLARRRYYRRHRLHHN